MKTTVFCTLPLSIFVIFLTGLHAATLEWRIPVNERLEMVRTAGVDYYVNKKHQKRYEERNIINLSCYERGETKSSVKGDFTVFLKEQGTDVFKRLEQHLADFDIANNGRYTVDKKYLMPNLRHLPTFPEKDIVKGEEWTSPAELIFNGFSVPFQLKFDVRYALKDIQVLEGREVAVVDYSFRMDRNFSAKLLPKDFPFRVFGKNTGRVFWDIEGKKPHMMDDVYHVVFLYRLGATEYASAEFVMNIKTRFKLYPPVVPEEKANAIREIEKELPKDGGISVDQDTRGIVLRLGEILFDFDSYSLKGEAEKNLDSVSGIIAKKYGDREVIVEGHTDNRGDTAYNQNLSEQRAHSVAKYLKNRGVSDKLSYRGYGEEKPIADNLTGEGRKRNRRVEVIIKLK